MRNRKVLEGSEIIEWNDYRPKVFGGYRDNNMRGVKAE